MLLLLPLAVVLVLQPLRTSRGPQWLGFNVDPAYAYLFNSLLLAEGMGARHTDHPGTTVQLIGAATLRVVHAVGGQGPLREDVIADPERFLWWINAVLVGVFAATLLGCGLAVYRATASLPLALLVQLSPFLVMRSMISLLEVRPEPLLLSLSLLSGTVVLLAALGRETSRGTGAAVVMGVLAGVGLVTKVTSLPLLALPLAILTGVRRRLAFLASAALSFAVIALPATHDITGLFRFLKGIAGHTGRYGRGDPGFMTLGLFRSHLVRLVGGLARMEWLFLLLVVAGAVVVALSRWRPSRDETKRRVWRVLAAIVAAQVLGIIMVTKDPVMPHHYLVPVFGLSGVALCAMALLLPSAPGRLGPKRVLLLVGAVTVVAAVFSCIQLTGYFTRRLRLSERQRAASQAALTAARTVGCRLAYGPVTSSPVRALIFGDGFAGETYRRDLAARFPDALVYNARRGEFRDALGKRVATDTLLGSGTVCVVVAGIPSKTWADGLVGEAIDPDQQEVVYRLSRPAGSSSAAWSAEAGAPEPATRKAGKP